MKRSFFQAAVTSILLYGCTTWTLTKRLEKKLDGNYTRMLRAILNKSWQQHPTRHQLYGHLPLITKTIQVRRTRHAGHCWRSRDELIRDVLLWIPTHGRAKAGRPARTYIQQLCEDTGCCPEDLPRAMNDREEWRERVRDIRATSAIWWWWYKTIDKWRLVDSASVILCDFIPPRLKDLHKPLRETIIDVFCCSVLLNQIGLKPSQLGLENMLIASLPKFKALSTQTNILDMTLNNSMERVQTWNFWECWVPSHCHYS